MWSNTSGYVTGKFDIGYFAHLVNSTYAYDGTEEYIDNMSGNATFWVFGNVTNTTGHHGHHVSVNVNSWSYPTVRYDRNYFVQNPAQFLYENLAVSLSAYIAKHLN
jgi:hypothetical protein